jgi:hypothetical protein
MDKFPKEMLIQVALELDMENIIKFCKTNKKVNSAVCENENFWRQKLLKDYPNYFELFPLSQEERYRKKYLRIYSFYTSVDETCQEFLNHFFGESQRYMDKTEYLKDFRDAITDFQISTEKIRRKYGFNYEEHDSYLGEYYDYLYDFKKKYEFLFPGILLNMDHVIQSRIRDTQDDPRYYILDSIDFGILSRIS